MGDGRRDGANRRHDKRSGVDASIVEQRQDVEFVKLVSGANNLPWRVVGRRSSSGFGSRLLLPRLKLVLLRLRLHGAVERYYAEVGLTDEQQDLIRRAVRTRIGAMAANSEQELARCNGVLKELAEQERKLLRTYYEDRVSAELYDEEQRRIRRERQQIEAIIDRLSIEFDGVERTLDHALEIVGDAQLSYLRADNQIRRVMNQAIFARIEISHGEEVQAVLAEPFKTLLGGDLFVQTVFEETWQGRGMGNEPARPVAAPQGPEDDEGPDPQGPEPFVVGSINEVLVGVDGIEPSTKRL